LKCKNQYNLIAKKNILILPFIAILLGEIYLPNYKANLFLQVMFLVFLLYSKKNRISIKFIKTIYPVAVIFAIGFIGYLVHFHSLSNTFKDLFYFIKPLVDLMIGYLIFRDKQNMSTFIKVIILLGTITATIHLTGIFLFSNLITASINSLRGDFGFDNFVEIFAFYFLLKGNEKVYKDQIFTNKWYKVALLLFLALSIYLYFSRTMLLVFLLAGFSFFGYARMTQQSLKIVGVLAAMIVLFYAYLFTIKLDREAKGIESFMYKIKIAPEEIFKSKIDRNDHQKLWDHWRGYEASRALELMQENPHSFITGMGYGSLVNLKFQAPLGESGKMKYISRLHNGYMFVFYKTGIFGLAFLLIFLGKLYFRVYTDKNSSPEYVFCKRTISTIGLFYLLTSLIITGIYIPKDIVIFILGGILSYETRLANISQ